MGSTSSTGVSVPLVTTRARLHQFLPNVGAFFGALGSQPQNDERRVGRAVDALHGSDDTQLREARNIGGVEMLRMLDAPAEACLFGMFFEDGFKDVQHFAIGAIADGVDAKLIAVRDGKLGGFADIGGVFGGETRGRLRGRSEYGSSIQAPREPSAPSIMRLMARTVKWSSAAPMV